MATGLVGRPRSQQLALAIDTLRRVQRSQLKSSKGKSVIDEVYVDPLPNDGALRKVLLPNPTLILGRRGTGKSTLIERAQSVLSQDRRSLSAYVDVRGLYLQTEFTQEQLAAVAASNPGVPERVLARVERDRSFIVHLLRSLLDDLRPDFRRRALFRGLEAMLAKAEAEGRVIDVNAATAVEKSWTKGEHRKLGGGVGGKVNPLSLTVEGELSRDREWQERYTDLVIKGLDHQKYVRELGELLRASKVDHLYVFLDDFSEIPAGAMRTLVDTVIAPLNNSSDSPIRFKIAAYPYQIYLGAIDPTKIDVVELDIDRLYSGPQGVASVEAGGADFISRLISQRLAVYSPRGSIDTYFDGAKSRTFWRSLFLASSGNPRILGGLLDQAYERDTLQGRRINVLTIEQASADYFRQRIWEGLERRAHYLQVAHDERRTIDQILDLVERLISASRNLSTPDASDRTGQPRPASHFCIDEAKTGDLASLELNFLVSRIASTTRPRDGRRQAVYAYNFGLCRDRQIVYSSQSDHDQPYYLSPPFDFTHLLSDGDGKAAWVYRCPECNAEFPVSEKALLEAYEYLCRQCKQGTCQLQSKSKVTRRRTRRDPKVQFSELDLSVLEELRFSHRPLRPKEIGDALGVSYQLITRRFTQLCARGYVDYASGRPVTISEKGRNDIFGKAG